MKFEDHTPNGHDERGAALNEALKLAIVALTKTLSERGIVKGGFILALFDGGRENPLNSVQLASNLPKPVAREFLQLLASPDDRERAANAPQIVIPKH